MREAVYDAFFKDFEEYKKKMAQLFHLSDLHDIIPDEFKGATDGTDPLTEVSPAEVIEPEAEPTPPQEP